MNCARCFHGFLIVSIVCLGETAQAGIIAHYTFNEGSGSVAHDSVGSANGTFAGSTAFVAGGISGGAVSLNAATNDLINMGNVLNPAVGDFSISAWVKTTQTSFAYIAGKQTSGTGNGYLLLINTASGIGAQDKGTFYATSSSQNAPFSTTSINNNQWHMLTGVYHNGGTIDVYVDGALEGSKTAPAYISNAASFLIGGVTISGTPTASYTGLVDDVQVYNNALTPANVQFLFANPGQATPEPTSLNFIAAMTLLGLRRPGRRPKNRLPCRRLRWLSHLLHRHQQRFSRAGR